MSTDRGSPGPEACRRSAMNNRAGRRGERHDKPACPASVQTLSARSRGDPRPAALLPTTTRRAPCGGSRWSTPARRWPPSTPPSASTATVTRTSTAGTTGALALLLGLGGAGVVGAYAPPGLDVPLREGAAQNGAAQRRDARVTATIALRSGLLAARRGARASRPAEGRRPCRAAFVAARAAGS